jgi:hypothetical protein
MLPAGHGDGMVDELVKGLQPKEEELESTPMCHGVLNLRYSNTLLACLLKLILTPSL